MPHTISWGCCSVLTAVSTDAPRGSIRRSRQPNACQAPRCDVAHSGEYARRPAPPRDTQRGSACRGRAPVLVLAAEFIFDVDSDDLVEVGLRREAEGTGAARF